MSLTREERAQRKAERSASQARMDAARAETRRIVALGLCPQCGRGVQRNSSLTGWYQCVQFGAPQFRKYPEEAPCNWQGFTE